MNRDRLIVTRPGGCVTVDIPGLTAMRFMAEGGRFGAIPERGRLQRELEKNAAAGRPERASRALVYALQFGGAHSSYGLAIIRDVSSAMKGTGIERWDIADWPLLGWRWLRDAWRRSPDGGGIWHDAAAAREIHQARLIEEADRHNKAELQNDRRRRLMGERTNGPAIVDDATLAPLFDRIRGAKDLQAIACLWPEDLPKPKSYTENNPWIR